MTKPDISPLPTAKQILEGHVIWRKPIEYNNYACVGIPYEHALNAVQEACNNYHRLEAENKALREQQVDTYSIFQALNSLQSFLDSYCLPDADQLLSNMEAIRKAIPPPPKEDGGNG